MDTMIILDIVATVTFIVTVFFMYLALALGLQIRSDGYDAEFKFALAVSGLPLIIALIVVFLLLVNGRIDGFEAFESGFISITIGCIIFSLIAYYG